MLNCKYLGYNEKVLLGTIMREKYNPGKETLLAVYNTVANRYDAYLTDFPNIAAIDDSPFSAVDQVETRKALESCYDSATKTFSAIRGKILTDQPEAIKSLCPYCLLSWPNTLDHYIGKGKFPEFSILCRNLIPCCGHCNNIKLENWRDGGRRRFIHFYNDNFLHHRFLRARLVYSAGKPVPRINYYLEQPGEMADADFQIVRWHFEDLDLLSKYNQRAIPTFSSEYASYRNMNVEQHNSPARIRRMLLNKYRSDAAQFCGNYYVAIIYETLANDANFLASLQAQP